MPTTFVISPEKFIHITNKATSTGLYLLYGGGLKAYRNLSGSSLYIFQCVDFIIHE